jgi:hypothetical protein
MASINVVFDEHVARIKRIVEQEFPGCSVVFDQRAWPLCRFHIQDAQETIVSSARSFSLAELENLTDDKLRLTLRRTAPVKTG